MDLKKILTIVLCAFLTACGNDGTDSKANAEDTLQPHILLSADGVGPINAQTPFNMHKVTLAFPDYSVEEFTDKKELGGDRVIRVSQDGKPLMVIHPDQSQKTIFSIMIQSAKVGNAMGHNIGSVFSDIYSYEQTEPCTTGSDDLKGKVLCLAPQTPNILYVFAGETDTPDTQTPPPGILASWKLDSIVWKPAG